MHKQAFIKATEGLNREEFFVSIDGYYINGAKSQDNILYHNEVRSLHDNWENRRLFTVQEVINCMGRMEGIKPVRVKLCDFIARDSKERSNYAKGVYGKVGAPMTIVDVNLIGIDHDRKTVILQSVECKK